jgi:hypothetical protein
MINVYGKQKKVRLNNVSRGGTCCKLRTSGLISKETTIVSLLGLPWLFNFSAEVSG